LSTADIINTTKKQIEQILEKDKPKDIMKYMRHMVADKAIFNLNKAISHCDDCELKCPTRTIAYGNTNASVMIIGDSIIDRQISDKVKLTNPFAGADNEFAMINRALQKNNVNMDSLFWINAVNCKVSKCVNNETLYFTPTTSQIEHCIEFTKYAVDVVHPAIIILMGNIALNIFKKSTIQKERGKWLTAFTIPAMPTYSPTHLTDLKGNVDETKRREMINCFFSDIDNVFSYLKNKYPNTSVFN
jgi:uracil-DNA glycosylase family 4